MNDRGPSFTTISDIGISELIRRFRPYRGSFPGNESGDADSDKQRFSEPRVSITEHPVSAGQLHMTAQNIMTEGVHFDLTYTPFGHLGYKLVVVVASRLIAKGVRPVEIGIGVATPNRYSVEMLEQMIDGANRAARGAGAVMKVLDTTAAHQALSLTAFARGSSEQEKSIFANTASVGDQICVTGDLGGAMAGLRILMREKSEWMERNDESDFQPDLDDYEYVIGRQLLPMTRMDFIEAVVHTGFKPSAMLDLSQGLINDLQLMLGERELGCELFTPAIPIAIETRQVADEMKEDVDRYAYYGGEDFELLFTVNEHEVEPLRSLFDDFTVIGEVKDGTHGFMLNTGEGKSLNLREDSPPQAD